jgi:hypothetical protein
MGTTGTSSSVGDVMTSKILDVIFNILPIYIRRWEIQTYLHRDSGFEDLTAVTMNIFIL